MAGREHSQVRAREQWSRPQTHALLHVSLEKGHPFVLYGKETSHGDPRPPKSTDGRGVEGWEASVARETGSSVLTGVCDTWS